MIKIFSIIILGLQIASLQAAVADTDSESDEYDWTKHKWIIYDWDMENSLSDISQQLFSGRRLFNEEHIIPIFEALDKMKPRVTEESSSSSSAASVAMHLEAVGEAITMVYDQKTTTEEMRRNRNSLVEVLKSIEGKFDPLVFNVGIQLILIRMGN